MFFALLQGFCTSGGLIVAIGAQNAFVIRQGLIGRHLLVTAFLCSSIDALLIIVGVLGYGQMVTASPTLLHLSKYVAILFLIFYGAVSVHSAFKKKTLVLLKDRASSSIKRTILVLLGFSLLNPHVYLDTVLLMGSIASAQPEYEQIYFAMGAMCASFVWFFALTYGSRLLAPLLSNPHSWRVIDILVALTMWSMAISMWMGQLI